MIKVLNLINGDEIIGDINEDDVSEITINYPFHMSIVDDLEDGTGVRMDYTLAFSKETSVQIKKTSVLYAYIPSKRMEDYYNRLVEYTAKRENDKILQDTLESMEEMDKRWKSLVSQKLVGKNSIN